MTEFAWNYYYFSSDDAKSRAFEKEKLASDLKNADEKLAALVEGNSIYTYFFYDGWKCEFWCCELFLTTISYFIENQEHLKKSIQSYGSVVTRIKGIHHIFIKGLFQILLVVLCHYASKWV